MSDWKKIKATPEYREAKREIEMMIHNAIIRADARMSKMEEYIQNLEQRIQDLENQSKKPE